MNLDLESLSLKAGKHEVGSGEFCVMEATAAFLGLPHSDRNVDQVCPRIEAYIRGLNDLLDSDNRQRLKQFIPRLANTRGTIEQDERKQWIIQETATRVFAAAAMKAAGLTEQADKLAECSISNAAESKTWAAEAAEATRAAWAARAAEAAGAARASESARAAEATRAARAAGAAGAARAAWAAEATRAARAAGAAGAAGAAVVDEAIDLVDRLIRVTEEKP